MSRLGAKVLGIDMVAESIEAAMEHLKNSTPDHWKAAPFGAPEYHKMSTAEVASKYPGEFDVVVASEVLEHVVDWEQLVCDAAACLKVSQVNFRNL